MRDFPPIFYSSRVSSQFTKEMRIYKRNAVVKSTTWAKRGESQHAHTHRRDVCQSGITLDDGDKVLRNSV